jgi:hypothetical protein
MASASFVEIIAHFAGYLRIFDDTARDRIEYDEGLAPRPSDDYSTLRPHYDHPVTPDDIDICQVRHLLRYRTIRIIPPARIRSRL